MSELVELAWPIAAGMLGETALGLCDTKLVGALGPAALAGVGVASMLLFLGYALIFGLMRGVKVRTAYAVGQDRAEDAVRYAEAGALLGVIAGVGIFAASRDLGGLLEWLGVDASMVPYAKDFIAARAYGAFATCAGAALIQYLQGVGDSRSPMVVGIAGNVINAATAYALIHGAFGLPALGVRGAGYATAATEVLELCALVWVVRRRVARGPQPTLARVPALREVATLGVPTGLHFVLEAAAFTAFTTVLGSMRAEEMAAHQIALNVIRASFLPGVAVAEAASVLVARALGQRSLPEADRVTRAALTLGVGFMSLCGIGFAVFGAALAGAFSEDPAVIAIARRLLLVAAVFQALDAVNMILRGALRGAKDVRWVAVVGTSIAWITIPGAAFVFGRLAGWGALGGWLGFIGETTLASVLMWRRWSRGAWRAPFGDSEARNEAPLSVPAPIV
ncbi:MATE efflux family protein [Minicystis rosea]|nr:MATE efflux family protein [Minicystis rosea]